MKRILLIGLCVLFAGISLYYGAELFLQWQEYRAGEEAYEELAQYVHPKETTPAVQVLPEEMTATLPTQPQSVETEPEDDLWPVVDFEALQQINPDVCGWICIEGTTVNYPVVQGQDNSYYVRRLLDGSYNRSGTIFLDYRNDRELTDRNSILYGHHMKSGTMFQNITKYKEQSFYDAHPYGLLMTPTGNYKLAFFSGYVTNMNDDSWKIEFASDGEYALWLEETISKSCFTADIAPSPQDRVMTLSTCTYEYTDARFVLVGVLIE